MLGWEYLGLFFMFILIVDDDPSSIDFVAPFVELKGIEYEAFTRADEALAAFGRHPMRYDAAILDMCMPGYMGTELAAQMRRKNPTMEFLFFTGLDDKHNVELVKEQGAYLHKPPWPDDVLRAINALTARVAKHAAASSDAITE
jgi:DNA-binding response OmpR family regulator